jgi:hypothetical protein
MLEVKGLAKRLDPDAGVGRASGVRQQAFEPRAQCPRLETEVTLVGDEPTPLARLGDRWIAVIDGGTGVGCERLDTLLRPGAGW